jgi:hypothetical protein
MLPAHPKNRRCHLDHHVRIERFIISQNIEICTIDGHRWKDMSKIEQFGLRFDGLSTNYPLEANDSSFESNILET